MRENPAPIKVEEQNIDKWHIRSSDSGYHLYFANERVADLFGSYYALKSISASLNESMPKGLPK